MVEKEAPLCACGCGNRVPHKKWGSPRSGWRRFFQRGCQNRKIPPYAKDKVLSPTGYVLVKKPGHSRATYRGVYVLEHLIVAEDALRRSLPPGVEVHHVDEDRKNNANDNLVICQDHAYHGLLHRRMDALRACGNANYRKCYICHGYDDVTNMRTYDHEGHFSHAFCWQKFMREYYRNNKIRRRANAE